MALSSRKQVEHLRKMRSGEGAGGQERPAEANGLSPEPQEELCSSETRAGQKQPLAKEPLASLLVNSEISIYKDPQEILRDLPNPDVKRFLNAGALQDILWYWYEKESGSPVLKPVKVSLESGPARQLPAQLPVASSTDKNAAINAAAKTPVCQTLPALQEKASCFGVPERDRAPTVALGKIGVSLKANKKMAS